MPAIRRYIPETEDPSIGKDHLRVNTVDFSDWQFNLRECDWSLRRLPVPHPLPPAREGRAHKPVGFAECSLGHPALYEFLNQSPALALGILPAPQLVRLSFFCLHAACYNITLNRRLVGQLSDAYLYTTSRSFVSEATAVKRFVIHNTVQQFVCYLIVSSPSIFIGCQKFLLQSKPCH